eukprot:symbB.v1.2.010460.t1/scaffold669.1/size295035/11
MAPQGRKMRATVVPPPSASLMVPDLSASLASPRGAYTVAVPIATNRSSSPPVPIGRVDGGYRDNGCLVKSVPVPMARTSATPTATVVTDKASSTPQRTVQLGRRSFAQSCSVPSLLSPRASIVAPSAEVVPSLAQIVIQQLNTPSRQARSSTGPQTARCCSTGTASSGTVPRPRLAELKPLLKDLFEEQAEAQDAQQLQSKIDQLQKLQQILQMQQEGLKQQQKVAQSYQPKVQRLSEYHPPARGYSASITSPRGLEVPFPSSPRARSSQACSRRRFLVPGSARAPAAPEPKATRDRPLNLGEAKELLKAFREIASSKEFQRTLGNIHKQGPDSVQKMGPMFIGQSFNRTLAMYDFPLSNEGYQDMARGISKHSWNVHVKAQAHEVERLLRMPPGAFFGIPGEPGQEPEYPPLEQEPDPKPSKPQAREAQPKVLSSRRVKGIEVVAKHAVDNVEV